MQEAQTTPYSTSTTTLPQHKAYRGKHAGADQSAKAHHSSNTSNPRSTDLATREPKRAKHAKICESAKIAAVSIGFCIVFAPLIAVNISLLAKSSLFDDLPSLAPFVSISAVNDSMSPTIESGDLIICKTCNTESISEGNIICFLDTRKKNNSMVIHRAIEKTTKNGRVAWRTQGDANSTADTTLVSTDNLIGVYEGLRIPYLGGVLAALQTPLGILVCTCIPLAAIALREVVRNRTKVVE